jgi:hypothetical protein
MLLPLLWLCLLPPATGSTGSARSRPDSSPYQLPKTASSSKPSKPYAKGTGPLGGGSGSGSGGGGEEDSAAAAGLKQLLGDEEDDPDEDCCPTCLDPYDAGEGGWWASGRGGGRPASGTLGDQSGMFGWGSEQPAPVDPVLEQVGR